MSELKCPDCGNSDPDEFIPYGDGYMCRSCGCEFGEGLFIRVEKVIKS